MREIHVVIVGGGPMCTYAMERLAALIPSTALTAKLRFSIFERTGRFGAGEAHSDTQPTTSYMNRIAGQIALAADESNLDPTELLPKPERPTFLEWCRAKYAETGDERFQHGSRDIPRRYLHGLALREAFQRYVARLRSVAGVSVDLYAADVTDVSRQPEGKAPYRVHFAGATRRSVSADHILFVTGHSYNHPAPHSTAASLASFCEQTPKARYVRRAYPLEREVTEERVPPGCAVGVRGLGLTAIDVFLHLTEGRGGTFVSAGPAGPPSKLRYVPSGREPAVIVGISPSGLPVSCRPDNAKQADPGSLEHRGVFLTVDAVAALRGALGQPVTLRDGRKRRQLDFDLHVFPLLILEMAYVYYRTLLGDRFGMYVRAQAESRYRTFLQTACSSRDAGIEFLLQPVQECFDAAVAVIDLAARRRPIPRHWRLLERMNLLQAFHATVFGPSEPLGVDQTSPGVAVGENRISPWGHSRNVRDHRFEWRKILDPVSPEEAACGESWQAKVLACMASDLANAEQGNVENPVKAACDGVWRDLRSVFSEVLDRGGLLPHSHQRFMTVYFRYYNRLSNGSGRGPMRRILSLIENRLLDISVGPEASVGPSSGGAKFQIEGPKTGVVKEVDVVVEGRMPSFDPERDVCPLYPNLLRRGLARRWSNPGGPSSEDFSPGALDLCEQLHPVQASGVDRRLTFIGAPAEGLLSFQLSAARPFANSYILNNIADWARELLQALRADALSITGEAIDDGQRGAPAARGAERRRTP